MTMMTIPKEESISLTGNKDDATAFEALQVEYAAMASWYDSFWADYLTKTLAWPLRLVSYFLLEKIATKVQQQKNKGSSQEHIGGAGGEAKPPITVVDVACGTGEFIHRLMSSLCQQTPEESVVHFIGVEPCPEMLEQAKKKTTISTSENIDCQWIQSTAEALPLQDASADIICSTNAFHFFRNKPLALAQMYRVLRGNGVGRLVITDWCADAWMVRWYHCLEWIRWNLWGGYPQRYPAPLSSSVLQQLVEEAGFQSVTVETYTVRFWLITLWGMQTVTASK